MKIELTEVQVKAIACDWIKQQQDTPHGYRKVLAVLFTDLHFAKWSWFDALLFAARLCAKAYHTDMSYIRDNLK